ncbi:MAG TPA: hypothetical protein VEK79_08080 [Thermoanaerobaculia bacterium]|nr:hypothetical protein [Thermoanaerobaculia bacterium]
MKRLLIATALTMCAAGAYASNWRGADQVYIPIAGHAVAGANTFVSDVQLANLTGDTVVVSVIYQPVNVPTNPEVPSTVGQEFKDIITLQPFERKEYKDFFVSALNLQSGIGLIILNGCKQGENCGPDGTDDTANTEHYRAISAESRIYSYRSDQTPADGTTGQLFSGIPWYNFVSMLQSTAQLDEVFVTGITHTANSTTGFRTNFGIINASQYSSTQIAATLYRGRFHPDNKIDEELITLTPLENKQTNFPGLFPDAPFGDNYFVHFEQRTSTPVTTGVPSTCDQGCPAFLAYASVLDNKTGDATTLESQFMKELSPEAILVVYPTSGKNPWRRAVRK